jgi:hypothetical protein
VAHWLADWDRLQARLHAHVAALIDAATAAHEDSNAAGRLLPLAGAGSAAVMDALEAFLAEHQDGLPEAARTELEDLQRHRDLVTGRSGWQALKSASAVLRFKLAALEYQLADREERWRELVERAFVHLDRLLVADPEVAKKWKTAFDDGGEPACERLGGAHLLHHGLWSFKSHAPGERTDLVLGTGLAQDDIGRAVQATEAMILTEWKCVRTDDDLQRKYEDAIGQLEKYAAGSLAGFELRSMRYAVTVGIDRVSPRPDQRDGGVTLRHVHIAIAPRPPSKQR